MTLPGGARWTTDPDAAGRGRVLALADAVEAADAVAAFSEPTLLDLRRDVPAPGTHHLTVDAVDGALVAYAHLDARDPADRVVELAVAPAHRGRGLGGRLAAALLDAAPPDGLGDGPLRVWAHGDLPAAARLAARHGLRRDRDLWMMRRGPDAGPPPERPDPAGVTISALRVGRDEADVVAVNARAFAAHPEQGAMTVDDVTLREGEPWFDPAGFLLARDAADGRLLGFHWTKVHPPSAAAAGPVGEVYVVGVDPAAQGRGLGGALTLAGLRHLTGRGLGTVVLYVEGDNAPAVATYSKLGFVRAAVDVSYTR